MVDAVRRGFLKGAAALIAGGQTVAREAANAISGPATGLAAAIPGTGEGKAPIRGLSPAADENWGRIANTADRVMDQSIFVQDPSRTGHGFYPHITALRSVPLATKCRMQREAENASLGPILRQAKEFGFNADTVPHRLRTFFHRFTEE